jgi:hypothetical protein
MTYRKTTLRKLPPVTRRYAKLLGELGSVLRKGKNLVEELSKIEFESQALAHAKEPDKWDTIFRLTREDVIECAVEMNIPKEAITDDILPLIRKGIDSGLECWSDVVKEAINMALKS